MNVFGSVNELTASQGKVALACGNFDGVHRGHQKVFRQLMSFCKDKDITPAAFTFEPHPRKVLSGDSTVKLLTSASHKQLLLKHYGIEHIVVHKFDQETAMMDPELFVSRCLVNSDVEAVFTGRGWRFGRSGLGGVNTLLGMTEQLGFEVCPVAEVELGLEKVSSSNIRDHILGGELDEAEQLLGRRFSLLGNVIAGEKIAGEKLGFPTANMECGSEVIPPDGVYAGFVRAGDRVYPGIINVGYSPTFHEQGAPVKVEFHLFDFSADLYGQKIEVEFVRFIRGERKFDSIKDLKEEITANITLARSVLAGCSPTMKG